MIEATDTRAPRADQGFPSPARPESAGRGVGPILLLMALGLLGLAWSISLADGGRGGDPHRASAVHLAGLVLIVLPAAIGVLLPGTSRAGRIVLAVALPVALQLGQLLLHPIRVQFSADDALRHLTRLSPQVSGALTVLSARFVLALAIVLLVEKITWSTRIGAVAGVVYACGPQLLFGSPGSPAAGQLAAATIGLPLAVLAGYLLLTSGNAGRRWPALLALSAAGVVAVSLRFTGTGGTAPIGADRRQQALVIGSLVITALVLVPALLAARRRLSGGRSTAAVLLCLAALLYPLVPGALIWQRLVSATPSGTRLIDELAGFAVLGGGFVVGCWLCRRPVRAWHAVAFGIAATLTFLGGQVLGTGSLGRQLPGSSITPAGAQRIDPADAAAAAWIVVHLPAHGLRYADRVGHPVDWRLTQPAGIQYVIADRRDAADAVATLNTVPGVDRIYDNGSIAVYDVRSPR